MFATKRKLGREIERERGEGGCKKGYPFFLEGGGDICGGGSCGGFWDI